MKTIIQYLQENYLWIVPLLYEVAVRLIPTDSKYYSILDIVVKLFPNLKKGGGIHILIFSLISFAAIGQQNFNARSVRFTPQDTATFCLTQPCPIGTVVQQVSDSILYCYRDTTHTNHKRWRPLPSKGGVYTASTPLVLTGNVFSIPVSTNAVNGYLSAADHTTFSNKENVLSFSNGLTRTLNTVLLGGALTGTTTFTNAFGVGWGAAPTGNDKFRITGLSSVSADAALFVENSSSTNLLKLLNDGQVSGKYFSVNNPQTIFGYQATISGGGHLAIGVSATATGTESHAIGQSATSSGTRSLVVTANSATGTGDNSTTIGQSLTNGGTDGIVVGTNSSNTSGFGAIAIGTLNQVTNDGSTAIGYQQKATGVGSIQMGTTSSLSTNSTANSFGLSWGASTVPDVLITANEFASATSSYNFRIANTNSLGTLNFFGASALSGNNDGGTVAISSGAKSGSGSDGSIQLNAQTSGKINLIVGGERFDFLYNSGFIFQPVDLNINTTPKTTTLKGQTNTALNGVGGNLILSGGPKTGGGTGNNGYIIIQNLPTTCAGAPTGALANVAGVLTICP